MCVDEILVCDHSNESYLSNLAAFKRIDRDLDLSFR